MCEHAGGDLCREVCVGEGEGAFFLFWGLGGVRVYGRGRKGGGEERGGGEGLEANNDICIDGRL